MSLPPNLRAHVEAYQGLVALRGRRPLSDEESQRLELLRDLLLEAQVALDQAEGLPRKTVRAPLHLDVSFVTPNDAARAFATTHDIGTGGMAFRTAMELPKGAVLALTITIPGWPRPLDVSAEVMWSRGGMVGLAFQGLDPAVEQRLKTLVTEHSSFLDRLGVSLGAPKKPAQPLVTERQKVVLVRLRETALAENTTQAVKAAGFAVLLPTADAKPVAIVGDSSLGAGDDREVPRRAAGVGARVGAGVAGGAPVTAGAGGLHSAPGDGGAHRGSGGPGGGLGVSFSRRRDNSLPTSGERSSWGQLAGWAADRSEPPRTHCNLLPTSGDRSAWGQFAGWAADRWEHPRTH